MSTRAKYSGAAGTIVDGRIRDLQEHRDLDFPVFARDVGTTAPAELVRVSEVCHPFPPNLCKLIIEVVAQFSGH